MHLLKCQTTQQDLLIHHASCIHPYPHRPFSLIGVMRLLAVFCNWQFCDSFQQFSDSFLTHPCIRWPTLSLSSEHHVLPKRYFEKAMSRQSVCARGREHSFGSPSSFLLFEWWRELRATTKRVMTSWVGGKFRLSHLSVKIFAHSSCYDVIPNI